MAKEFYLDNPRQALPVIARQYTKNGIEDAQVVHDNFRKDYEIIKKFLDEINSIAISIMTWNNK